MRDGPLLSRPRPRADRRLPRAPGRAVRRGGRRGLGRHRQADPHRHRARGRRTRQPRVRVRSARAGGSATRRRTGPSPRSSTSGATRASASGAASGEAAATPLVGCSPCGLGVAARRRRLLAGAPDVRRRRLGGRRGRADGDAPPPAPPVWSPRRVPQPFVDAVGATNLQAAVDALVARHRLVRRGSTSPGSARSRDDAATRPSIPASTQKLLTAAAALGVLGPDFRSRPSASTAAPPANGTIDRPLPRRRGRPGPRHPGVDRATLAASRLRRATAVTPFDEFADGCRRRGALDPRRRSSATTSATTSCACLPALAGVGPQPRSGPLGALVVDHGFTSRRRARAPTPRSRPATTLAGSSPARGSPSARPSTGTAPRRRPPRSRRSSRRRSRSSSRDAARERQHHRRDGHPRLGCRPRSTATTEAGAAGDHRVARRARRDLTGVSLVDGSGLSARTAHVRALLETLGLRRDRATGPSVDGLAVAAQRGRSPTASTARRSRPPAGQDRAPRRRRRAGRALRRDRGRPVRRGSRASSTAASRRAGGLALTDQVAEAVDAFPQSPPAAGARSRAP